MLSVWSRVTDFVFLIDALNGRYRSVRLRTLFYYFAQYRCVSIETGISTYMIPV